MGVVDRSRQVFPIRIRRRNSCRRCVLLERPRPDLDAWAGAVGLDDGQQQRVGRAHHRRHGAGGRRADRRHVGHLRQQRQDQGGQRRNRLRLHLPVGPGGQRQRRDRHRQRGVERLHPGDGGRGQDAQGPGELQGRQGLQGDAHQRGDGHGGDRRRCRRRSRATSR